MVDSLFATHSNAKGAKKLWGTLESKYIVEDYSNKKFLVRDFNNYKKADSLSWNNTMNSFAFCVNLNFRK